ncbi:hypothetical protein CKAH01_03336 [Colletotrichum kahawae]|uniref:Uncharacterized protein n=1 Tax=Colletotrichum kahawae TaxID=34407 RepID=A0AAE0DFC8_COLKA|nr:hypothetical protein CKAH01_03336 [Colletotrichum kahawae]
MIGLETHALRASAWSVVWGTKVPSTSGLRSGEVEGRKVQGRSKHQQHQQHQTRDTEQEQEHDRENLQSIHLPFHSRLTIGPLNTRARLRPVRSHWSAHDVAPKPSPLPACSALLDHLVDHNRQTILVRRRRHSPSSA